MADSAGSGQTRRLTKRRIDAATYRGNGRSHCIEWDSDLPGFGLRIYPSGAKSFVVNRPQCTVWLAANHRPLVRDDDEAIWRRILVIPFEAQIPADERDPKVKERLTDPSDCGPAVLAWLVRGCLE